MKHVNVALFVPHEGCPNQCSFCNQRAISGKKTQVTPADVDKAVEIALRNPDSKGGEIAFFGGSFTAIRRSTMVSLLEAAHRYISDGSFRGIRISTRPDAVDEEICGILRHYGVTAVELGAQSLDDRVLTLNKRGHTAEDVASATRLLKKYGFETGLQMMTGLYGSTDSDCIGTAMQIVALRPDTVRIYPTVVLENTLLCDLYRSGEYKPQTVEEASEICAALLEIFHKEGINVIRTGLHSGGDVEGEFVAGAYHPAFKEICESRIYLKKAFEFIRENKIPAGKIEIRVHPKFVSPMTGQKKANILALKECGYTAKIKADDTLEKYTLIVTEASEEN
ncbi:MAG: radical SAM protein [Clostridia bacterium]|nr:radical SAM protein [Clostridia bacterium]